MHEVEHRSFLGFALAASVVTGITDIIADHCDNLGVRQATNIPWYIFVGRNALESSPVLECCYGIGYEEPGRIGAIGS